MAALGCAAAWPAAAKAQQPATPDRTGANGITALAARNNAIWCDTVCRAHDRPGEFQETLWLTRLGAPRFYPDVVTTAGAESAPAQSEAIAALIASNPRREWSVKDSFKCLQLNTLGFRPLFDAEWIAMREARTGPRDDVPDYRSTIITDEAGLIVWEQAWAGGDANAAKPEARIFKRGLLADANVVFVSIQEGQSIAGGGILNRGADVVGLSNLFGAKIDLVWQRMIAMAGEKFPGLPLVGYEHGDDLVAAKSAGFETVGSLRIWMRRAAR